MMRVTLDYTGLLYIGKEIITNFLYIRVYCLRERSRLLIKGASCLSRLRTGCEGQRPGTPGQGLPKTISFPEEILVQACLRGVGSSGLVGRGYNDECPPEVPRKRDIDQ